MVDVALMLFLYNGIVKHYRNFIVVLPKEEEEIA